MPASLPDGRVKRLPSPTIKRTPHSHLGAAAASRFIIAWKPRAEALAIHLADAGQLVSSLNPARVTPGSPGAVNDRHR